MSYVRVLFYVNNKVGEEDNFRVTIPREKCFFVEDIQNGLHQMVIDWKVLRAIGEINGIRFASNVHAVGYAEGTREDMENSLRMLEEQISAGGLFVTTAEVK